MAAIFDLFDWAAPQSVDIDTVVLSEWDGGASVSVIVKNTGTETLQDWALAFEVPGEINYVWDASIDHEGVIAIATPDVLKEEIAPGEASAFGFNILLGPEGWEEPQFQFGQLTENGSGSPEPDIPGVEEPDPDPAPAPTPDAGTPPPPADNQTSVSHDVEVSVIYASTWATGFSANILLANPTTEEITLSEIFWSLPDGVTIDAVWNADVAVVDGLATFVPNDGFTVIGAGQAVSIGLNASHDSGETVTIDPTVYVLGTTTPNQPDEPDTPSDTPVSEPWDGTAPLNPIIGTQSIGPGYTFTGENGLVETAKAIRESGSNILKIALDPTLYGMSSLYQWQPVELLTKNEAFQEVLAMDFDHYFFWLERSGPWADNLGISPEEYEQEYKVTYDLARHLLETFEGTGKTFYIGNWETDWNLLEWNPTIEDVNDTRIDGLVDWINLRQDAVDQAKMDVQAEGVSVFHYLELNRVDDARTNNFERVVNEVLPRTNVDLVSYSAYDVLLREENIGNFSEVLARNLDYIASLLPEKEGLPFDKRVFIGEFGFYLKYMTPEQQYDLTLEVLKGAVEWGTPFALIWQMYDTAANEGLYLIGPDGRPTAIALLLEDYNQQMAAWFDTFRQSNGRSPTDEETRIQALNVLNQFPSNTA
ncbi:MAG: cellulose binding domain-containing protein [Roseibium sp.]|uniref:cellulose binding domain-containing protein n=1 Tax=Roseibium sp. TaxID=1936156 RepID=UPI002628094D|nr:cellulose binding domain-containing protein [Roseibium sp.]MCV0428073.1 cellulose binding domain-containing protein [Roseibium sp.]